MVFCMRRDTMLSMHLLLWLLIIKYFITLVYIVIIELVDYIFTCL